MLPIRTPKRVLLCLVLASTGAALSSAIVSKDGESHLLHRRTANEIPETDPTNTPVHNRITNARESGCEHVIVFAPEQVKTEELSIALQVPR